MATFLTVHFGEWRSHWHGMPNNIQTGASMFEDVPHENQGALAIFDYDSGQCLRSVTLDTPAGFVFGAEQLFVNSMHGNRIACLDRRLQPIDGISCRMMSDLHSLAWRGSNLLLTSSGVDAVIEVAPTGRVEWEWFATDHGYRQNPMGFRPRIDHKADYRMLPADTGAQTTHCNSAVSAELGQQSVVLATLFHQGELIAIDRVDGSCKTLVTGMSHPHSVRSWSEGWMMTDSRGGAVVLMDRDFGITKVIEANFNWVQDCIQLPNGNLLIADANNSRLVEWSVQADSPIRELRYPDEWKIYQVEHVNGRWAERLQAGAEGA